MFYTASNGWRLEIVKVISGMDNLAWPLNSLCQAPIIMQYMPVHNLLDAIHIMQSVWSKGKVILNSIYKS